MKRIVCFLSVIFAIDAKACLDDEVSVLKPMTQNVACVKRWEPEKIVLLSEKNCSPCRQFLDRMRKELLPAHKKTVHVIWLESDPSHCLQLAQQFSEFGAVDCASRDSVQEKWQIVSTPTLFWMKDSKQLRLNGMISKGQKLPWN